MTWVSTIITTPKKLFFPKEEKTIRVRGDITLLSFRKPLYSKKLSGKARIERNACSTFESVLRNSRAENPQILGKDRDNEKIDTSLIHATERTNQKKKKSKQERPTINKRSRSDFKLGIENRKKKKIKTLEGVRVPAMIEFRL